MYKYKLPDRLHRYISQRKKGQALNLLSRITSHQSNSLITTMEEDFHRYVGYFRMNLLIDWGYYREALAWACLETELYPGNREVKLIREKLKRILGFPSSIAKNVDINTTEPDWSDIAGMHELKYIIKRDIIEPLQNPMLYEKFRVPVPSGYIFYGPPGCGKTYFARKIADLIGYNFQEVKPSDVASTYVNGGQIKIREMFDKARENKPVVLFVDEFNTIAPERTSNHLDHHYISTVDELLTQLDKSSNDNIVFIGATNYVNRIDSSVLRPGRIDKKIFVGPPDYEARSEAFKIYLMDRPCEKMRFDILAEMSEYFTFAEIKSICDEAARNALQNNENINTDLVAQVLAGKQPYLSEDKIAEYSGNA